MQISSIALSNFKSYADAVIPFQPGVNAIIGQNGAGKSSILEAIGFVLFNCRGTGYSRRLREGATHGEIRIKFVSSFDDREYEVERAFSADTTTRYRATDLAINQTLADGVDDVQRWLARHLRVEPGTDIASLFENTIGVPQGTFTAPFLLTAAQRKSVFDPLLQVEEYGKAAEKLLPTSRHLSKTASTLQADAARLEGTLTERPLRQAEAESLAQEVDALGRSVLQSEQALQRLAEKLQNLDAAEAAIRTAEAALHTTRLACNTLEGQLNAATAQVAEAEQARKLCAETRADHQLYVQLEAESRLYLQQQRERDGFLQKLSQSNTSEARLTTRQEALHSNLADIRTAAARTQALLPNVASQDELEARLAVAEHDCSELAFAQRQLKAAQAELEQALSQVQQMGAQLEQARAGELELTSLQDEQEQLATISAMHRDELARVQAEIERLQAQFQLLESPSAQCPVCRQELTPSHRQELLAENRRALEQYLASQPQLHKKVASGLQHQQQLASRMRQLQAQLRRLPSETDHTAAQAHAEQRRAARATAQQQAAQYAQAPAERETLAQQLAQLGNPRQELALLQERAAREPAVLAQLADIDREMQLLQAAAAQLKADLGAYEHLDEKVQRNQAARDVLQPAHLRYLANAQNAAAFEPRQARAAALTEKLDAAKTELNKDAETLASAQAAYDQQTHNRARQDWQNEQNALTTARTQQQLKAERLDMVNQQLAELAHNQLLLEEKQRACAITTQTYEMMEQIRGWLKEAGPQITRRLVNRISQQASSIYSDIMDDHSGWLRWQPDYELELELHGAVRSFRQLSGGEQMTAALALRLALLRHTSAIDIAFFDEPTAHLDPDRRDNLAAALTQVKGFTQVFVISHDDTFERSASNYIRIIKGGSGSHLEVKG